MPHGKFTAMRCTLAFDSLSLGCFVAWLSIWLWSIRPTAMAWHDECCWWSHMAMPVGLGLIHMHKKQPRHFDRGLQVIKVVKIVVWYENPAWKGAGKQWLKTLVWPPQKILEMLIQKNEKKWEKIQTPLSRQRGLGQKLPGVQNHHPNSTSFWLDAIARKPKKQIAKKTQNADTFMLH